VTPENRIRNAICSWLTLYRCFCFIHDSVGIYDTKLKKFRANKNRFRIKGVSDILGIWEGKFLAIEVKAGKNRLTQEQKVFLDRVNQEGGIGLVARSIADVEQILKPKQASKKGSRTDDQGSQQSNPQGMVGGDCGAV
jgi:penicillin-binding protein-related factor A (putative recombinase)